MQKNKFKIPILLFLMIGFLIVLIGGFVINLKKSVEAGVINGGTLHTDYVKVEVTYGEDVTGTYLRTGTYSIKFIDEDPEPNSSGLQSCEYYINSCDPNGLNCNTLVVPLTPRDCNSSIDITPGPADPLFNLESDEGVYYIISGVIDNAEPPNSGWDTQYMWFDFTPPTTTISPNGTDWVNSDVGFTSTCTDEGGSGCKTTEYRIIDVTDTDRLCDGTDIPDLNLGTSDTVTCPTDQARKKRVCFRSIDNTGNEEGIRTSNLFKIDKAAPTTEVGP